ncbi:hypothetical protein SO802_028818 [Lithocarpus litseifolius]|uniref:Uncharacterized protein n=1 Tax=Lithocarpus litseifolius TaxID=425828 RepID=A0AAW2BUW1_9ROSI
MEQSIIEGLLNLRLTKEEKEEIPITTKIRVDLLEECLLRLFHCLLTDRHQNQRALKSTLKSAWKMGSNLQIVEMEERLISLKHVFTHSPFRLRFGDYPLSTCPW